MAPSSTSSLLIKGFLPVRLKLPGCNHYFGKNSSGGYNSKEAEDETFFFVKPHVVSDNSTSAASSKALFVINVPVVPKIRTNVLLKALLGRFGDVERVTVVDNPRNNSTKKLLQPGTTAIFSSSYSPVVVPSAWSKPINYPSYLPPVFAEGKFAHVEFTTAKEMKRALKVLKEIMSEEASQDDSDDDDKNNHSNKLPALRLEKLELQTLVDETQRQYRSERHDTTSNDEDHEDEEDQDISKPALTGILAVAGRYRTSYRQILSSRSTMLDECDAVMEAFEDAEESNQRSREAAAHEPDDDGFVTVTYSNTVNTQELESAKTTGRRANKRSRTKKESVGASQLPDFYRFQRKENKKRDLQELRQKFEEDLAKVKRMKEEQQYKPFR